MEKELATSTKIHLTQQTENRKVRWIGYRPRHFDAPPRPPGSVEHRSDFMYMDGHGTFYKFDENHYDESFLDAKEGDIVTLVLYNLNTEQLDEISFELMWIEEACKNHLYFTGFIADCEECFKIKINFFLPKPLESSISVIASARPYYGP